MRTQVRFDVAAMRTAVRTFAIVEIGVSSASDESEDAMQVSTRQHPSLAEGLSNTPAC